MLRKFTKPVGRFAVGSEHDYPAAVWNKLAAEAKMKLDSFTVEVKDNPVLQNPLKGRPKIHTRLGATA